MADPLRRPRFPVPFQPGSIPDLIAAWLPDRGLTPSAPVASWTDQAFRGRDAAQATASKRPTQDPDGHLPAHPQVVWDGVDDYMDVTWSEASPGSFTFYTVLDQVDGGEQYIFSAWDSASGTGPSTEQLILVARTAGGQVSIFDGDRVFKDVGALQTGRQILTWVLDADAGTCDVYRDAALLGSVTYNPPASWDTVRLGAWATDIGTRNYNGGGYVFVYAGAHDAATRLAVIIALLRLSPITGLLYTAVTIGEYQLAASAYGSETDPAYYASNVLTHDGVDFAQATTGNAQTPPAIGLLAMGIAVNLQPRKGTVCVIGRPEFAATIATNTVGSANYITMTGRVAAAGVTPSLAIIASGENDVLASTAKAAYKADLEAVVADMETNWSGIITIILQTQIVAQGFWDAAGSQAVREAQQEVAAAGANRFIIDDIDHLNNLRPDIVVPNSVGRDILASKFVALIP